MGLIEYHQGQVDGLTSASATTARRGLSRQPSRSGLSTLIRRVAEGDAMALSSAGRDRWPKGGRENGRERLQGCAGACRLRGR